MIPDNVYPIFTLTMTVLACFILGPPKGLTAPARFPAGIVFGFAKNRCAHIFSVLFPANMTDKKNTGNHHEIKTWSHCTRNEVFHYRFLQ